MNTPRAGDTWTLEGKDPVVVEWVRGNLVHLTTGAECSVELYHQLATRSLAMGATLSNMTPEPAPALSGSHNSHARLAPSSSKRWSTCTGSVAYLEANAHRLPDDTGSIYAQFGTDAHDWAAKLLTGQIQPSDVPEEFREFVVAYRDHCQSHVPNGVTPQVETQVQLFYQPDQTGTCDFAVITDQRVAVYDLKMGAGVLVESVDNTQLAIYSYSLIRMVEDVYDFTDDTVIDIGVFQPRHREAHLSEPWVITLKDLREFCDGIGYAAIQATAGLERVRAKLSLDGRNVSAAEILEAAPGLKFKPGEGDGGACRFCPARAFCEVRLAAHTEDLAVGFTSGTDLLAMMPDLDKDEKKLPVEERVAVRFEKMGVPSEVLTDDYLVRMFAAKKWIESCLADVEEWLEARALGGDIPEGTKLVLGRAGNRAWISEELADNFLRGQRLKDAERYDYKLKSPTKIEEMLKDKLAKTTRTKNLFESLITRSEPKKVLALASDKREAVAANISALPDLDSIGEDDI